MAERFQQVGEGAVVHDVRRRWLDTHGDDFAGDGAPDQLRPRAVAFPRQECHGGLGQDGGRHRHAYRQRRGGGVDHPRRQFGMKGLPIGKAAGEGLSRVGGRFSGDDHPQKRPSFGRHTAEDVGRLLRTGDVACGEETGDAVGAVCRVPAEAAQMAPRVGSDKDDEAGGGCGCCRHDGLLSRGLLQEPENRDHGRGSTRRAVRITAIA